MCEARMTNSESVYDNRLMACKIFAERNATYRWIDGMKLIVLTTIPDILPFLTTKPGHTRCQFARGKSHTTLCPKKNCGPKVWR